MSVNNARHSRFFWRSSALFCVLDFERQFIEVNTAWENLLGLSTGHLLAKPFLEFVHPDDQPSTAYYFQQLEEGLSAVSFSCRFRHHDGFYRTILWEINNAASVEYAYYVVGMDISSREQPMVADEMLSVLQEGVVLQYANGTIGACNPSAEKILGLSAEQMMGWTLIDPDWKAIHDDGSPFPTETHPAICTLRTGQPFSDVVMGVMKPDGTVIWIRVNSYPLWRDDVTTPYAVVISFSDITHYKEIEQNLRKSAGKGQLDINQVPEGNYELWDWNLQSNEIHLSPRWKKMLGFEPHELPNTVDAWQQRIHPADYKRVLADIQNLIDGLIPVCENVHRVQHRDGNYRWIANRAVLLHDSTGKPDHIVGTHIDVTEPRRLEEQVQETEKKYRQLLEVETDAILLIDVDSLEILDANKAASHIYGYSRNQLLQTKMLELSAQSEKTQQALKKSIKNTSQQYHRRQNGEILPVEVTVSPFVWEGRQVLMVAVRDVSERQKIETALWESESKYRQLFEAASNPTLVYDANSQYFFDVNRAAVDLYGYGKEEFLRMTTEDVSAESQRRAAFSSSTKKVQVIPLRWHKKKDGTIFPVEISAGNTYLFQGRSLICATVRDITERKAAEEAIRKEKDFINTLVQASPAFFFAINPDGKTRMINRAMLHALEYELDEVLDADYLSTFVPENERAIVSNEFENLIKTMQPSLLENHILTKSGKTLLVEWHSRAIVKANGALDYFFGVGIDVTERRKAQGHLRLFKSIIESSEEAISIHNPEGELIYINPSHERLFNRVYKEAKQISYREYYPETSLQVLEREIMTTLIEGGSWEGELEMVDSHGTVFPVWQRADAVRDAQGNILFHFSLMHDVSERQRMWETLRKQWEEQQMIFNTVPAMIWYRDKDNKLLRTNKLAQQTLGNNHPLIKEMTDCEEIIQLGKAQHNAIFSFENADKETRWLQVDKIPYRDHHNTITGVIIFALDITEYKQIQASLQASEERMYLVVENMPLMLNAFDEEGNLIIWNRACEDTTGYSANDLIGNPKAMQTLYPDVNDRRQMLESRFRAHSEEERKPRQWETRIACKDGDVKTIAWTSVARQYPIPGWRTWHIGQDITEQRQVEKTSKESEGLFAGVFSGAKLGFCLTDDRGRFIQVNHAYAELYGYRPEEMIGQPFTLVLPSAIHSDAVREYYSILMTRDEPTFVKRRGEQHRNGQVFDVEILASRVILEDRRRLLVSIVIKQTDSK